MSKIYTINTDNHYPDCFHDNDCFEVALEKYADCMAYEWMCGRKNLTGKRHKRYYRWVESIFYNRGRANPIEVEDFFAYEGDNSREQGGEDETDRS